MVIETPFELGSPRRKVYCKLNELVDNGDGTYGFVNLDNNAIGFGSEVYVVDSDKKLLFDNTSGILYDWS